MPDDKYLCPLFLCPVKAGFPSTTEDEMDQKLNLNDLLIKHPAATFFVRVSGDSMTGAGIYDNDILVVDRSIEPIHGKVVIAVIDGELTVKRLFRKEGRIRLLAENERYPPIEIAENGQLNIWGVVTSAVHIL